jgi:cysteinyl-tRNA synthetase
VGRANALLAEGALTRAGAEAVRREIESMDGIFAVLVPGPETARLSAEEQALFDERQEARRRREFARADAARARLESLGVLLEDTPTGTRWRRRR